MSNSEKSKSKLTNDEKRKIFYEKLNIVSNALNDIGVQIDSEGYDGLMVKKLPQSDLVSKNRENYNGSSTNIALTSSMMDIFPYMDAEGYFKPDNDTDLKSYFITKIKVHLSKSNIFYLENKSIPNSEDKDIIAYTSVVRAYGKNRDQMEVSLEKVDDVNFKKFRRLLYENYYLIVLKHKGKFEYDFFAIIPNVGVNEEEGLSSLDKKFFKIPTNTMVSPEYFGFYLKEDSNKYLKVSSTELESIRITNGENILLYGVPGSGKSWTIKQEYCNDEKFMERVVFHPDYSYSDFIGQILPKVESGEVKYKFVPGPFTSILKKAYTNPKYHFFLIIEEINRGNAPAIFGDIFQLLDRIKEDDSDYPVGTSEYGISNSDIANIVYGDKDRKIRIPSNLSIIATMNTSDQNVFTLDTAFKRRWNMRMIENNFDNVTFKDETIVDTNISWEVFCIGMNELILDENKNTLSSEDKRLGTFFINEKDLKEDYKFAEKVLMYLWDDAFKFNRNRIFNEESVEQFSLENIIKKFKKETGINRFNIFTSNVIGKFKEIKVN